MWPECLEPEPHYFPRGLVDSPQACVQGAAWGSEGHALGAGREALSWALPRPFVPPSLSPVGGAAAALRAPP